MTGVRAPNRMDGRELGAGNSRALGAGLVLQADREEWISGPGKVRRQLDSAIGSSRRRLYETGMEQDRPLAHVG